MTHPCEPVGLIDIAARLGVQRKTPQQWQTRGRLPDPDWPTVSGRPVWCWVHTIRPWAQAAGKGQSELLAQVRPYGFSKGQHGSGFPLCRVDRFPGFPTCENLAGDYVDMVPVCRHHFHALHAEATDIAEIAAKLFARAPDAADDRAHGR